VSLAERVGELEGRLEGEMDSLTEGLTQVAGQQTIQAEGMRALADQLARLAGR
jgi:hypothetical protein